MNTQCESKIAPLDRAAEETSQGPELLLAAGMLCVALASSALVAILQATAGV